MVFLHPDIDIKATLTRLMTIYEKDILRFCCIYLQDIALAEDATQETFLKAYKALSSFRGEAAEKTWLMRIAINTCKDIRRAAWYRYVDRRVTLDHLPEPAIPPKADSILLTLEVMRLPTKERETVLLRYYLGMTMKDIAEVLHVTSTTVSKRLSRACQKLSVVWKEDMTDE